MSKSSTDALDIEFDKSERVGVLGSPSSTAELTVDILGTAVDKQLVGGLTVFKYSQNGKNHYALGQITEIRMRNIWSEDATMRSLIRQKGSVDPVTERQDTHTAVMTTSAVFSAASKIEPSVLGTVPPTGTSIRLVNQSFLDDLLSKYKSEIFYLGRAYGTNLLLPLWFKHFGHGTGGAGEAYHLGVFGKTGSGKSVLSKMILVGYSRNESMSILVLDPQGEFSKIKQDSQFLNTIKKNFSRDIDFYSLHNIFLTDDSERFDLFGRLLIKSGFLVRLGIKHPDNQAAAVQQIVPALRGLKPWELHKRESFNKAWKVLGDDKVILNIYSTVDYRIRVQNAYRAANPDEFYDIWSRVGKLFTNEGKPNASKIKDLAKKVTSPDKGAIVIIDLSETDVPADLLWNEDIMHVVLNKILEELISEAEKRYKENQTLNTLVIIDEAHRLAPREVPEENVEAQELQRTLVDGIRTTRKYGLGWMFISQTLSSLHRDIINQLRIYFFGFGLGWGIERLALKELIGGKKEAISLYQSFKDPQSTLDIKEYSFMTVGPVSPLSFSGSPLFFTAADYPQDFLKINSL